jgi:hypothetical protein
MIKINKKNIYDIPFHDSDLVDLKVNQHDNGTVDLWLKIIFNPEELDNNVLEQIQPDGTANLLFKDCRWLNMNMICNRTKRDEIDFLQIVENSAKIDETVLKRNSWVHIDLTFMSGSKLNCITNGITLLKPD